jgi:hypothetical protein
MSLFEYYRMNIPLFAPSLRLLKRWCDRYDLMWERTYGWPARQLDLLPVDGVPDPNDASDKSYWHWMPLADLYTWPHVRYFDSFDHLLAQLDGVGLQPVVVPGAGADRAATARDDDGDGDEDDGSGGGGDDDGGDGTGGGAAVLSRALRQTSEAMRAHNAALREALGEQWADILERMRRGRDVGSGSATPR